MSGSDGRSGRGSRGSLHGNYSHSHSQSLSLLHFAPPPPFPMNPADKLLASPHPTDWRAVAIKILRSRLTMALGLVTLIGLLISGLALSGRMAVPQAPTSRFDQLHTEHDLKLAMEGLLDAQYESLLRYAVDRISLPLKVKDFQEFAYRLRVWRGNFEAMERGADVIEQFPDQFVPEELTIQATMVRVNGSTIAAANHTGPLYPDSPYPHAPLVWKMEQELFPWAHVAYPTLLALKQSYSGRGIVIPTGSHHFRYCVHLIRSLRHLGCTLPISVAYGGQGDMQGKELSYLRRMNVSLLDVSKFVDSKSLELKGWQIKPFALLMSPFSEVILMDADIVWMQNPERLFRDEGYLRDHAIFFPDRTLFPFDVGKTRWLEANVPPPLSPALLATRMYRQISGHEQESGVIVYNKQHRFFSLLATCKMNGKQERDAVTYQEFYGDKESFWIGVEMMQETYTRLQETPGAIGEGHPDESGQMVACGRICQFDREGQPLWLNGAIVLNKRDDADSNRLMPFTHWAREGVWNFTTSCVNASVTRIEGNLKQTIKEMGKLWRPHLNLDVDPDLDLETTEPQPDPVKD